MAKLVDNTVLDGAWNVIKSNCNLMTVCSTQPTTRSQAITSYKLASVAMTSADFAIADGSSGGRKITVGAKSSVSIDSTGSAEHVALVSASALLYVTTCTKQSLSSGNKVNIPAWKATIGDP